MSIYDKASLVQKERNLAEYYTTRFIDHMSFNNNLYPEYEQNSDDDVYPDKDSLFNGWVLTLSLLLTII